MPIKLNSTGGGSVSIDVPSTASTYTLTAPAETGNIITTGTTSRVMPKAAMPSGSVIQVVQAVITNTFSTTSQAWVDITGLSVNITPTSSTSKILVLVDLALGPTSGSGASARLLRNGSAIYVGDAAGSRLQALGEADGGAQYSTNKVGGIYLDSPATTSAVTYKLQTMNTTGTNTTYVGSTGADRNTTYYDPRTPNSITVLEIAQ
jgi:hypothetical protein